MSHREILKLNNGATIPAIGVGTWMASVYGPQVISGGSPTDEVIKFLPCVFNIYLIFF